MRITQEDLDWWLQRQTELDWRFAKSMPDSPHSYVIRDKTLHEPEWERAVRVIRTFGDPGKFWSRTHLYLNADGRRYWTMGDPLATTTVINVADDGKEYGKQDAPVTYTGIRDEWDEIGTVYDDEYPLVEETQALSQAVTSMFGAYAPSVLDIGCGTGRVLDTEVTAPSLYTGVDSSQAMLNELVRKSNKLRRKNPTLVPGMAELVIGQLPEGYDLGVMAMGVPSFVSSSVIEKLAARCSKLLLMPLTDGENAELCRNLDGAVVRCVGDYDLVTVGG